MFDKKILCLFVFSLCVLLNFAIPPFQNPDEPAHFKFILIHAFGAKRAEAAEAGIIRLMDKNNWWRHVGLGRPETLPVRLRETEFIGNLTREVVTSRAVELYHFLMGKTAGIFFKRDIETFYFFCRLFSVFLFAGSILLVFSTFGKISNFGPPYLVFAAPLVLFLPQFALVNFSVNPDALAIFICCLFFSLAVSLFPWKFNLSTYFLLLLIAAIGLLTDKSILSLILFLLLIPLFFIKRPIIGRDALLAVLVLWIIILAFSWIIWFFPSASAEILEIIQKQILGRLPQVADIFSFDPFNRQFFSILFESSFFRFGWMAFHAGNGVSLVVKIVLFSSLLGIVAFAVKAVRLRFRKLKDNLRTVESARMMIFFAAATAIQLFLTWIVWAPRGSLAQGRYLFPVIVPISALLAAGVYNLFSIGHRKVAKAVMCALVTAEFLFFNYAVWNFIVPVFHLTRKAPFPGM